MNIKPIRTDEDYQAMLAEAELLMSAQAGTVKVDRLDVMATLLAEYEARNFPTELPDPIDVIKFSMDQKGLTPKDLVPMIGRLNRVYEILNGSRALSLPMIRKLHEGLGIPVDLLIKATAPKRAAGGSV